MFIQLGGHQFLTVSHGSARRTILAHSGWAGNNEDWLPTLEILSQTWRTVAYDHRGVGETVVSVDEITADALVDDIFGVMNALGIDRCVIAGFSSGTLPALCALLREPGRFDGLVLANGAAGIMPPGVTPAAPFPKPSAWPGATHSDRMRWFIERCLPEPNVEHFRRWGHDILMRATPEAAERLFRLGQPPEQAVIDGVANIGVPTLLIHGEIDPFISLAAMQNLLGRIPGSKLAVVPAAGHIPTMTQPEFVASRINEYFNEHSAR
jgi:pimeloyl-ACP methyl ester carboxylesterase